MVIRLGAVIHLDKLAHHGEPGDPTLFHWIQDRIDSIFGVGPALIVVVLGIVIVAVPVGIMAMFLLQRARHRRL